MKGLLFAILFTIIITDPIRIGQINRAKQEAKKAYVAGDYESAARQYRFLTDSLNVTEDEVLLNLGHSYYHLDETENALAQYQSLSQSGTPSVRSTAHQQLGVIKNKQGKPEEALNHFKEAIKSDPGNEDARYNYELLRRKLDEQKKQQQEQQKQEENKDQQQKDQKKDQQNKDDQNQQDKKDQEKKDQDKKDSDKSDEQKEEQSKQQQEKDQKEDREKKENQPSSQKLEQMKISEEKAKMILEAMKNQEIQYLQQNKRKATQPRDKSKPDW
jgi:Ca-activated chloride channel family protein